MKNRRLRFSILCAPELSPDPKMKDASTTYEEPAQSNYVLNPEITPSRNLSQLLIREKSLQATPKRMDKPYHPTAAASSSKQLRFDSGFLDKLQSPSAILPASNAVSPFRHGTPLKRNFISGTEITKFSGIKPNAYCDISCQVSFFILTTFSNI